MTIAENIRLEQEMSIIRDPLDQTKQMTVNADGSISVSPVTGSVQVVSGAAAVGATPTVPPVGVSGIDGSGLKRSLLTDSTGQMMTTEQDSAVFTASVSSASVLFTADMTNWRSVLLQIVDAGTSCTIVYECGNNQTGWTPTNVVTSNATASGSPINISSTIASQYQIQKRGKYLRARVSVYGSGTVSVAYSLSLADVNPAMGACVWGTAGEGGTVNGNPVTIGVEARNATKILVGNGSVVRPIATVDGRVIVRPHSLPENEWSYAAASGGIVNTASPVTLVAAVASVSIYVTSIQLRAQALGNATEIALRDGSGTVLWRSEIGTSGMPLTHIKFENPLKVPVNSSLTFITLTASGTGAVYISAQGYKAP